MTDTDEQMGTMLRETAARVFQDHTESRDLARAEAGEWPAAAWDALAEAGLHRAMVPEAAGGFGVPLADALTILRPAGEHALPLPLTETMLAGWLLGRAGIEIPDGPVAIAPTTAGGGPTVTRVGGAWRISGAAARVAWGRRVPHAAIVAPAPDGGCVVALIRAADWTAEPGENVAREPRDTLTFAGPVAAAARMDMDPFDLRLAGAAARTQQIAGALAAIAATTVQYAQDRVQFGRPIGKFQAVQQSIATLAGQVAAARAAADIAAEAVGAPMRALPIAAGKARAGEAASIGAAIAHQVHGAIGFTFEHRLHFLTKRLWSWRDEFGNDSSWQKFLGRRLAQSGADAMWPTLTAA